MFPYSSCGFTRESTRARGSTHGFLFWFAFSFFPVCRRSERRERKLEEKSYNGRLFCTATIVRTKYALDADVPAPSLSSIAVSSLAVCAISMILFGSPCNHRYILPVFYSLVKRVLSVRHSPLTFHDARHRCQWNTVSAHFPPFLDFLPS